MFAETPYKFAKPQYKCRRIGDAALMHMLVDGICMCCLYLLLNASAVADVIGTFLTYNILAFMSQPLTGFFADIIKQRHWMLIASVAFMSVGVLLTSLSLSGFMSVVGVWLVAVILGVGNSLFHVWGGKQTVLVAGNDMRAIGVFVSTGAFGLSLGYVFCSWPLVYAFLLAFCLLSMDYLFVDGRCGGAGHSSVENSKWHYGALAAAAAVVAIMAVVLMRSYIGEQFSGGIVKNNSVILMVGAVAMIGKMAGGWLAKSVGVVAALTIAVVGVAVCWMMRGNGNAVLLAGLFLVNLTMPVTLYLANAVMRGWEGLAFGLLAAVLLPGSLLAQGLL